MTWWAVGTAVVGAVVQSDSARKAGNKQGDASASALEEQRRQYDLNRADQQPYKDVGYGALRDLTGLSQMDPTPDAATVMGSPGYQFGLKEGLDNVQNTAAARGGLYSGGALKALTRYGNDYATTKFNDENNRLQSNFGNRWNRLAGLAGIGQSATNQTGKAGAAYANEVGDIGMLNAKSQGANGIAQANVWGNTLNQVGSALGNSKWWQGASAPQASYSNEGRNYPQQMADGGPVRAEPVVGTRSPLREGGGGGLSRAEILRVLRERAKMAEDASVKSGVGALVANPVTDPRAILAERERAAGMARGGAVKGPGGPRSDSVPAMLSNGEHVIRASAVTALGKGKNSAGQKKLSALQTLLDGGHHGR